MAQVTNAFDTYEAKGNKEELSDLIYNISPFQTPFLSSVGKSNVSNVVFDWQTEVLPTPSSSGKLEGFELSRSASTATSRVSNVCMISSRGANGSASSARTNGTRRDLTEAMVKDVQQQCFSSGAEPSILMCGPYNKSVISGFTGRSQARQFVDANTVEASVSIYSGDFGELQVVPSNRSREQAVHLLDPEFAGVAYLRDFETIDISTIGDAETKMIVVEYGLEMKNEAAHGIIADVKVSDSDAG